MRSRKLLIVVILAVTILSNASSAFCFSVNDQFVLKAAVFNQRFFRTELYFGTDKNDGTEVSVEEWNKFLADEVTPRFPDGFTVLEGYGQFRNSSGKIVREKSKVLILLYPLKSRKIINRKIEQIRTVYKKAFNSNPFYVWI